METQNLNTKERPYHQNYMQGKKEKQYNDSARVFIISAVLLLVALALALIFSGCSSPAQLTGTGYLVTIENGRMMKWDRVESAARADSFIFEKTALKVQTENLIGEDLPYWDMKSGRKYIYVEKKSVYQRKPDGRKIYRDYQGDSSELKVQSLK